MKTLVMVLSGVATFALTSIAHADDISWCTSGVQKAVQAQADSDKFGMNVKADQPSDSSINLGQMDWVRVPVRDVTGVIVGSYSALVGETCQVMSIVRNAAPAPTEEEACAERIQIAVNDQAKSDKLGMTVKADSPSGINLGQMVWVRVPVRDMTGVVITAYSALVGETCQVMSIVRN